MHAVHCCMQTSMCTVNTPEGIHQTAIFAGRVLPVPVLFLTTLSPLIPSATPPSSLHSLSKGVVRGWGCPSKVHVLELIQTAGETRSCSDAGRQESGAVNPRCLLVLPVSLSISQPAGQSLRRTCRSPSARGAPTFPTPLL